MIQDGDLDWGIDHGFNNEATLQVDGNDVVAISDVMIDGSAHITVWATSHPDSKVAWEGFINVRERGSEGEEEDDIPAGAADRAAAKIGAYLGAQREWTDPAGMLEAIAEMITEGGFRDPGHPTSVAYYREQAERHDLGLDFDEEDEDDA